MPVLLDDEVILEQPDRVRTGGPNGRGPRDLWPYGRGGGGDGDDHGQPHERRSVGLLGMRFMLVSITVLFVAIFLVYYLRSRHPANWQRVPMPNLLWSSTAIMLFSSWTLERARRAFHDDLVKRYAAWLLGTLLLGVAFMASQVSALRQLMQQGIYLRHNPHSSLFYVVTGAHGLHLLGGLLALLCLQIRAFSRRNAIYSSSTLLGITTLYWHFLDALWIALFCALLLW